MTHLKQQLIIRHALTHPIRDCALQSELHRGGSTTLNYMISKQGDVNLIMPYSALHPASNASY